MPYIDRDKFLKSMTSKFKCVPLIGVPKTINGEECFDGEDFEQVLNQTPTEDVVPRSEVERWERKYKTDIEIEESTVHRLQNILLQFTDIVHKWGNKNGIDTTEISLVPILEQEANSIIEKAKQEVAMEILGEIDFVFKTIKMEIDTHIGEAIVKNEMSTASAIQYGKDVICVAEKALLMALKKYIGEVTENE